MKVVMMGNREDVKGGITSVISQIRSFPWDQKKVRMVFIPTYTDTDKKAMVRLFGESCVELIRRLRAWKPAVVYIHMSYRGSFERAHILQQICLAHHTNMVVHLHGSSIEEWYDSLRDAKKEQVRLFFEHCAHVITLGEHYRNFVLAIAPSAHVSVLYNTVKEQDVRAEEADDGVKRILYMGVLEERKGVRDLIDAFDILKKTGNPAAEGWRLVIAGSGAEEGDLVDYARSHNLWDDDVEFAGWVQGEAKDAIYRKTQIFVLPSCREGLAVSVLEAMSYGIPVISTDVGDMKEAVADGQSGILVKPGEKEELAGALETLMKDETLRREYGEAARMRIHDKFNEADYPDHLCAILRAAARS